MKLAELCRIELYRFLHSMEIVKYFFLVPVMLFSMCYINIFSVRNDIATSAVWGSMSSIYMYIIATICVLIAIYVGREFRYKTINYEVIRGYCICKIAAAKTVTCGIIVSFVYTVCMSVYLVILSDDFSQELFFRIFLMSVIYLHICSSSVLYVMICKSGILGGIIAFIRFYLGNTIGQLMISVFGAKIMEPYFQKLQVFNQWYGLINIEQPIDMISVFCIFVMLFIEYGMLLFLLKVMRKHFDFA